MTTKDELRAKGYVEGCDGWYKPKPSCTDDQKHQDSPARREKNYELTTKTRSRRSLERLVRRLAVSIELNIRMTAKCDLCGKVLDHRTVSKEADIAPTRWDMRRNWEKENHMTVQRPYRRDEIYCQPCADGAKPPNEKLSD